MYDANSMYGADPTIARPTANPVPEHQGAPEPTIATNRPGAGKGLNANNPIVALMVVIAVAIVLTQITFKGEIAVKA